MDPMDQEACSPATNSNISPSQKISETVGTDSKQSGRTCRSPGQAITNWVICSSLPDYPGISRPPETLHKVNQTPHAACLMHDDFCIDNSNYQESFRRPDGRTERQQNTREGLVRWWPVQQ